MVNWNGHSLSVFKSHLGFYFGEKKDYYHSTTRAAHVIETLLRLKAAHFLFMTFFRSLINGYFYELAKKRLKNKSGAPAAL